MKNDGVPFLAQEDALILRLASGNRAPWPTISRLFNEQTTIVARGPASIRNRYRRLVKRYPDPMNTCTHCLRPKGGHVCPVQAFARTRRLRLGFEKLRHASGQRVRERLEETSHWARELGMWPF